MGSPAPSGRAGRFAERTILGAVSLLKETVSSDEIASRSGFLQRRDPRFKCLSMALLLVAVLLTRSVVALTAVYAACLALALLSAITPGFFLKRTLLFVPLFSFFIVVPAIFSVVTPGEPLWAFTLFGYSLSVTRQGIDSALIFFMRVLASVSLAVLLVLTTRHHVLLKVLRIFGVPQLFVMTMGMCYRYIYLFLDIMQTTMVAIRSRVGYVGSSRTGRGLVAGNMAGLWLRSYRLHSQVYDAMLSRGYSGEPRVLEVFRARALDYGLLCLACATLIGVIWLNRSSI